jgi:hypothetical protein
VRVDGHHAIAPDAQNADRGRTRPAFGSAISGEEPLGRSVDQAWAACDSMVPARTLSKHELQ